MTMTTRSCLLLASALLVACQSQAPAPAPAPEPAAMAPGPSPRVDRERRLALLAPTAATPIDRTITELQERIKANPAKLDGWILLGRAWVRKARESADPG